jgi:hypothetical protein
MGSRVCSGDTRTKSFDQAGLWSSVLVSKTTVGKVMQGLAFLNDLGNRPKASESVNTIQSTTMLQQLKPGKGSLCRKQVLERLHGESCLLWRDEVRKTQSHMVHEQGFHALKTTAERTIRELVPLSPQDSRLMGSGGCACDTEYKFLR